MHTRVILDIVRKINIQHFTKQGIQKFKKFKIYFDISYMRRIATSCDELRCD